MFTFTFAHVYFHFRPCFHHQLPYVYTTDRCVQGLNKKGQVQDLLPSYPQGQGLRFK